MWREHIPQAILNRQVQNPLKEVDNKSRLVWGEEEYLSIDMDSYTQRVFSMFGGKKRRVRIRFINPLLDTAIERFGTKDAIYSADGNSHFIVAATVEISDQFLAWVCGFRKKATIIAPSDVVEDMKNFLSDISDRYKNE